MTFGQYMASYTLNAISALFGPFGRTGHDCFVAIALKIQLCWAFQRKLKKGTPYVGAQYLETICKFREYWRNLKGVLGGNPCV